MPDLVAVRAGGLVPIARQYPGAREFVESYRKEFPGADLSYQSAAAYTRQQLERIRALTREAGLSRVPSQGGFEWRWTTAPAGHWRVDWDGVRGFRA